MTIQNIKMAPQNSMFFISDIRGGEVPEYVDGKFILYNNSTIMVRCLSNVDGETDLTIGAANKVNAGYSPAFDGVLDTPSLVVGISTARDENILRYDVQAVRTRVRVWVNTPVEPDRIIFGFG